MEVINRRVKPLVQITFWQNICFRHALEEMTQHNQYTGNNFYIIDPLSTHFSLVFTAVFPLITSSPSAVRYRHPQFPRQSYASAALYLPHSDHC